MHISSSNSWQRIPGMTPSVENATPIRGALETLGCPGGPSISSTRPGNSFAEICASQLCDLPRKSTAEIASDTISANPIQSVGLNGLSKSTSARRAAANSVSVMQPISASLLSIVAQIVSAMPATVPTVAPTDSDPSTSEAGALAVSGSTGTNNDSRCEAPNPPAPSDPPATSSVLSTYPAAQLQSTGLPAIRSLPNPHHGGKAENPFSSVTRSASEVDPRDCQLAAPPQPNAAPFRLASAQVLQETQSAAQNSVPADSSQILSRHIDASQMASSAKLNEAPPPKAISVDLNSMSNPAELPTPDQNGTPSPVIDIQATPENDVAVLQIELGTSIPQPGEDAVCMEVPNEVVPAFQHHPGNLSADAASSPRQDSAGKVSLLDPHSNESSSKSVESVTPSAVTIVPPQIADPQPASRSNSPRSFFSFLSSVNHPSSPASHSGLMPAVNHKVSLPISTPGVSAEPISCSNASVPTSNSGTATKDHNLQPGNSNEKTPEPSQRKDLPSSSAPASPPTTPPTPTAASLPDPIAAVSAAPTPVIPHSTSESNQPTDAPMAHFNRQFAPEHSAPDGANPVHLAQMVSKAAQSEMRIGLMTPAFGSVEVRTVIHASDVGVLIGSEKGDLRSLLANDILGITHTLQQQNLRLTQVNFQQQGLAFSSDSSSGGHSQQRSFLPKPETMSAISMEPSASEADPPARQHNSAHLGLSILA